MELPFDFGPLLLASFLLGFANAISHGSYSEPALALILVAIGILTWRFVASSRARKERAPTQKSGLVLRLALVGLVSMPITAYFDGKIIAHPEMPITGIRVVEAASLLLLLTYLPFLGGRAEPPILKTARFALFGVLVLVGGILTIHISPAPTIDVWDLETKGAHALMDGHNPFTTVTVHDTDPENTMTIPYVYPPTAVYFGVLGLLLGNDVRYAQLLCFMLTGIALRYIARHGRAPLPSLAEDAAALFFWLTPLLFFILELSWIDPVQVMLITLAVAAFVGKKPSLSAAFFGIAISSKQSMFWLIPLAGFVLRFKLREWIIMGATAFALVLPFILLDFHALKHANLDFMTGLPPRSDALAIAVWFVRTFHRPFPGVSGFILAGASVAYACLRMRRSIAGFATATALTFLVFFFFNKWAFANYYFLLTSLSALAAAAALAAKSEPKAT